MTLHKLFKELRKLSDQDRSLLWDSLHQARDCERLCKELGVKYTDKKLAKFVFERSTNNLVQPAIPTGIPKGPTLKQIEQVILGSNLDIIEEAAEKKGLI